MATMKIEVWTQREEEQEEGQGQATDQQIDMHLVETLVEVALSDHRRAELAKPALDKFEELADRYERQIEVQEACLFNPDIMADPVRRAMQTQIVEGFIRAHSDVQREIWMQRNRLADAQRGLTAVTSRLDEIYGAYSGENWEKLWAVLSDRVEDHTEYPLEEVLSW